MLSMFFKSNFLQTVWKRDVIHWNLHWMDALLMESRTGLNFMFASIANRLVALVLSGAMHTYKLAGKVTKREQMTNNFLKLYEWLVFNCNICYFNSRDESYSPKLKTIVNFFYHLTVPLDSNLNIFVVLVLRFENERKLIIYLYRLNRQWAQFLVS